MRPYQIMRWSLQIGIGHVPHMSQLERRWSAGSVGDCRRAWATIVLSTRSRARLGVNASLSARSATPRSPMGVGATAERGLHEEFACDAGIRTCLVSPSGFGLHPPSAGSRYGKYGPPWTDDFHEMRSRMTAPQRRDSWH
jgi:hypothetical protein